MSSIQFQFQGIPIPSCDLAFNSIPIPIPSCDFSLPFNSDSDSEALRIPGILIPVPIPKLEIRIAHYCPLQRLKDVHTTSFFVSMFLAEEFLGSCMQRRASMLLMSHHVSDWLREPRDPPCNIQLQEPFSKMYETCICGYVGCLYSYSNDPNNMYTDNDAISLCNQILLVTTHKDECQLTKTWCSKSIFRLVDRTENIPSFLSSM